MSKRASKKMKVVLMAPVPKLGNKYDIVSVSPGFARNFLIPNGKAKLADGPILSQVESMKKKSMEDRMAHEEDLKSGLIKLDSAKVVIKTKINEAGHLFASIDTAEIAKAVNDQLGVAIEEGHIMLDKPIKDAGEVLVPIEILKEKKNLLVVVESE